MIKTLKYATISTAFLTFLYFLTGCAGTGSGIKHDNTLINDNIRTYRLMTSERHNTIFPVTSASINSAEKAAHAVYSRIDPSLTLKDMDVYDGAGEKEPTELDEFFDNMQNVLLKGANMSYSKNLLDMKRPPEDLLQNAEPDLVRRTIEEYDKNQKAHDNRFKGGSFFVDNGSFFAAPRANGLIPDIFYHEYVKAIKESLKGVRFSQGIEYTLTQKGKNPITADVYTVDGIDGIVRGLVTLYNNGYEFIPVLFSDEDIKKTGYSRDKLTHKLDDKAAGRYIAGLLATGAVMLYEPALGIPVAAGSLYLINDYGLVTSADGLKKFSPAKEFSGSDIESMADSYDSNIRGIELGYDKTGGRLVSLTIYTAKKPSDMVQWEPNGVFVKESDKLITAFFKEALMAGGVAALFKAGHNTAEGSINYIKTGVSGGRGPGMPVVK